MLFLLGTFAVLFCEERGYYFLEYFCDITRRALNCHERVQSFEDKSFIKHLYMPHWCALQSKDDESFHVSSTALMHGHDLVLLSEIRAWAPFKSHINWTLDRYHQTKS